jgi:ABC-type uncharacterized transport system auxiliary subunit
MMMNRISTNRMGLLLIGAGMWMTLWGCASGPAPIDHYYRIDAGIPSAPAAKKLEGNLQIDRLRADALTGKRQLLYKETAGASEIRQHPYQRWADPPSILLQTELVSFLSAAAVADSVIAATARVKPDYVVSGRIREFERVLGPEVHAVVEIQLAATSTGSGEILVNRIYREERGAANASVEASVIAFNEAVHIIFEQFLADLTGS